MAKIKVTATVTYSGFTAEMMFNKSGDPKKPWRRVLNIALIDTAKLWRRKMLKGHFTSQAYRRYGIPHRTKRYNALKTKLFGHTKPLDWTGKSKAKILGDRKKPWVSKRGGSRILGTKGQIGVSVRIHADRYFFMSKRGRGKPRPLQEVIAITLGELARLQAHFVKRFEQELKRVNKRFTKKLAA